MAAACALPSDRHLIPAPRRVKAPRLPYAVPVAPPAWGCWLWGGSGGQLGDARLCLGMGAGSTPGWHSPPLGAELDPTDPSIPTHTP